MKLTFYLISLHIFYIFNYNIDVVAQRLTGVPNNLSTIEEAWVNHYSSGLAPSFDRAVDIEADKTGNVYVTGYSSDFTSRNDYLTIKYDASGNQVWAVKYNGPGNGTDEAVAITIDAAGNIYVIGTSVGDGSSTDYATIMYNSDGVMKWAARYNGPGNSKDEVVALAMDKFGNVYVTGKSVGTDATYDFATVKYNSSGEEQWVARWAGPSGTFDAAIGLAVAGFSGNIYVTGVSASGYITIKYSHTGEEQWIARYDSSWASPAIAVDDSENVYVIGASYGSRASRDYATIKYDSSGVELWVRKYDGPDNLHDGAVDLVIDTMGNIYVTGESQDDFTTIKYSPAGAEEWVARYSQTDYSREGANDIEIDSYGYIYVTGTSSTVKYNATGSLEWQALHEPPPERRVFLNAIAVDDFGNALVTGFSRSYGSDNDYDFETAKYDLTGQRILGAQYNNQGNSRDEATAMTVDNLGNIFVTGWSLASGSGRDYLTIKYDGFGKVEWINRYSGPGNSRDQANSIAVDDAGNVYVTGQSYSNIISFCTTIKYNNAGEEQWIAQYWGPDSSYNAGRALTLDDYGNIYVTGSSTIKYNNSGAMQWVVDAADFMAASAIELDASGNVYLGGGYIGKLDSMGVPQWSQSLGLQFATGSAVDDSGNVFTTGWFENAHGNSFYVTQKHNTDGDLQWNVTEQINSGGRTDNMATALAIDDSGNVYVTGVSISFYATVKYNRNGVRKWVANYHGAGYGYPVAITLDDNGYIYVTGRSDDPMTFTDYATMKYNKNGIEQWVARYNGPRNSNDSPSAFFVDGAGSVYVTGTSTYDAATSNRQSMYSTVKYLQNPVAVEDNRQSAPAQYDLLQNYPNPFNPSTNIRYVVPKSAYVTLRIYNLSGQEVATLVNEQKLAGGYKVQWAPENLPSGLYLYRLQTGKFVATRKLIFVK